ncbi:MAG TPA: hypothetical protein VJ302_31765 [Blastocatellia bacterium]|nr:hypothetical protein [Blastocatellia bacterium]
MMLIAAAMTSQTSALATEIAADKDLAKQILDRACIPVPQGAMNAHLGSIDGHWPGSCWWKLEARGWRFGPRPIAVSPARPLIIRTAAPDARGRGRIAQPAGLA